MKGGSFPVSQVKPGQRWHYSDNTYNIMLEIVGPAYDDFVFKCKVVGNKTACSYKIGEQVTWNFTYSPGNYEYLEGQDRPA